MYEVEVVEIPGCDPGESGCDSRHTPHIKGSIMFNKLLCWLGIHSVKQMKYANRPETLFVCVRCGKKL